MVEQSKDPYLYPGTEVLRNKANIHDKDVLKKREAQTVGLRLAELGTNPINGPFDQKRLLETHRALFGDLYDWAGKIRANTGMMHKTRDAGYTVPYGPSEHVQPQLAEIFTKLKSENYLRGLDQAAFSERLAYFYGELDSAHPFREGNSRTLRVFTADLARESGYRLSWDSVSRTEEQRDALFFARDVAVLRRECGPLAEIISKAIDAGRELDSPQQEAVRSPRDFFVGLAQSKLPATVALPDQKHAEYLLDSVFKVPTGQELVRVLSQRMTLNEERSQSIRGIFTLSVKADKNGVPHFSATLQKGREREFAAVLRTAGEEPVIELKRARNSQRDRGNDRTR